MFARKQDSKLHFRSVSWLLAPRLNIPHLINDQLSGLGSLMLPSEPSICSAEKCSRPHRLCISDSHGCCSGILSAGIRRMINVTDGSRSSRHSSERYMSTGGQCLGSGLQRRYSDHLPRIREPRLVGLLHTSYLNASVRICAATNSAGI